MSVNLNALLLAVALWPGQTSHQLAGRLGLHATYAGRRKPYTYPVRKALDQLAREGYVRSEDEPGGRGSRGWHRRWFAVSTPPARA